MAEELPALSEASDAESAARDADAWVQAGLELQELGLFVVMETVAEVQPDGFMRIGEYVIAGRGNTLPVYGAIDYAVAAAKRLATKVVPNSNGVCEVDEWAVFLPACRSNTAGTMLVRGKGRRVRWFPEGREAAGLPAC
jgi:hypothetical protein